jgi:acyl-coenzyme A thioesterase PaaI-like protein
VTEALEARVRAATLLRELGHSFAAHDPDVAALDQLADRVAELIAELEATPERSRTWSVGTSDGPGDFRSRIPEFGTAELRPMLSDTLVIGGSNPMGLGAYLTRDGDQAVMQVTLGKSFEGAAGRAHGGILAALIDETMGLAVSMNGQMALTGRLEITYRGPAPIGVEIVSRAWVEGREGRKITVRGRIAAGEATVLEATGLFIAVDVDKVLAGR